MHLGFVTKTIPSLPLVRLAVRWVCCSVPLQQAVQVMKSRYLGLWLVGTIHPGFLLAPIVGTRCNLVRCRYALDQARLASNRRAGNVPLQKRLASECSRTGELPRRIQLHWCIYWPTIWCCCTRYSHLPWAHHRHGLAARKGGRISGQAMTTNPTAAYTPAPPPCGCMHEILPRN